MKKCDLHIHTKSTLSDSTFDFDLEVLVDYVQKMSLDVIAVTNHNVFDINQFQIIHERLHDCVVLPGIEVDLENGHILVIADNDTNSLFDFNNKCQFISQAIPDEKSSISFENFRAIFCDFFKYLFIPHYDKKPSLSKDVIAKFNGSISAGEVSSVKKFIYMTKDTEESLTPVRFSDIRIKKGLVESEYSTNHTYLDMNGDVNIQSLRLCLMDRTKSVLSSQDGCELFQIFENGQQLSTGLNIMYGKRSSGKTYMLNQIAKKFEERAKYIRQFELLQKEDSALTQFEAEQKKRQLKYAEDYLDSFRSVVNDFILVEKEAEDVAVLNQYVSSLFEYADAESRNDAYSKAAIYSSPLFPDESIEELKRLIESTLILLETSQYANIVSKYIERDKLGGLLKEFIELYRKLSYDKRIKKDVNAIIRSVSDALQQKSAVPRVQDIDLYKILLNQKKRERFSSICEGVKKERIISKEQYGHFIINVSSRAYRNASELKSSCGISVAVADAFRHYDSPIKFLDKLVSVGVDTSVLYLCFAAIDYSILNSSGLPVSGGERSEFNFIQKIRDARLYDVLIIDEPESSFDNVFLKDEVNGFIKEMADVMPVIVSTHNNTIGRTIKPDYVIYTEKTIQEGEPIFKVYSGSPSSKYLKSVQGEQIENYLVTINSLEAGEHAYLERKEMYEILKN